MIVVSTQSGQLGIMANHVPIIATLDVDETRVKYDDKEDDIAVNGGFIEFSNNVATIVADSAETQMILILPVRKKQRRTRNRELPMPVNDRIKQLLIVLKLLFAVQSTVSMLLENNSSNYYFRITSRYFKSCNQSMVTAF